MGKTSYQDLQKLIAAIEAKIAQLKDGNLPVSELDALVKSAADLHERLAVVRFKAYEKYGEPVQAAAVKPQEAAFDLTILSEPKLAEKPVESTAKPAPELSLEVDFSAPLFEAPKAEPVAEKIVKQEIPVVEPEVKKPIHVIREEVKPDSASLHEKFLKEDDVDLNDILKKEDDLPLRKKLGLTPIKDLKAEIGIGKKFEYINFLFAGDNKAYDTAINELNNCPNAEVAKQKLNVYASVYKWDLEEKTIIKFVELVERRFL